MRNSSLKRSAMAHVNEGSHSFTCYPRVYPQMEWTIPASTLQPQSVTTLWLVRIFRPAEDRRRSWPEWLVTNEVVCPPTDGHPSQYLGCFDVVCFVTWKASSMQKPVPLLPVLRGFLWEQIEQGNWREMANPHSPGERLLKWKKKRRRFCVVQ